MRCLLGTKSTQILLCVITASAIFLLLSPSHSRKVIRTRRLYSNKHEVIESSTQTLSREEIIDYRRCSPLEPLRIFVHHFDHPLAVAFANHPTATLDKTKACLFIAFTSGDALTHPSSWHAVSESGANHVIINLNADVSISPEGREMIVQSSFEKGNFRPLLDFSLATDVQSFDSETWQQRPSIMPLKREFDFSLVVDFVDTANPSGISQVECARDCASFLLTSSFCILQPSRSFHSRLLSSLRTGCIPVVLSTSQPLPFQDQLDWRLASFRFPPSMLPFVPEMLEKLEKEDVMEMRRRGRVFLTRIDNAQALAKSLVAALSERIHIGLPLYPEVPSQLVTPNRIWRNKTYKFTRIHSRFGSQKHSASRLYSSVRWNSGRDLTYTPISLHDVPQMPGDAAFYEGTMEHIVDAKDSRRLGLTRDEEQFTVMILTYNRDEAVKDMIEKLRNCPYLNKIIIVWNNLEQRPNGTWPKIHVPVEFVVSERNSLNSRFVPYDNIETEAVVSMDDDMDFGQPELIFGFRMSREHRDRVVGYPDRFHRFKNGRGMYGLDGKCEYSMIITSFAFIHKEFFFEYTYNQHPAILEYIDHHRNCEDIAMNYLVSHLTRKPPLKVVKKENLKSGVKTGLSARGRHYLERNECIHLFTQIYGYNPLLFSQEVAKPTWNCMNGL